MKVVINRCFGGFGLSDAAFEKLLTRKGIAFECVKEDSIFASNYYEAGHLNDEDHSINQYDFFDQRSDADLVAVVEEMGKEANGWAADLEIVDIPDDVKWHIHEYDGIESVHEDHRVWP